MTTLHDCPTDVDSHNSFGECFHQFQFKHYDLAFLRHSGVHAHRSEGPQVYEAPHIIADILQSLV